jgi:putative acetyltransferase
VIEIREERPEDVAAIRHVLEAAFGCSDEADIVERLRESGKAVVSVVAECDGQVVGHIMFSPVTIDPEQEDFNGIGLAPVAVLSAFQKRGIGSHLICEGLEQCRKAGYDIVVVLGDHTFYERFGFSRAGDHGLGNEYGVDEDFMAMELSEGALAQASGTVKYQPEFSETAS